MTSIRVLLSRAVQSPFLRHNAIFLAGSTAASFLNYLYYPVLGRLLAPSDFGEVQAIISFFLQTGVFLSVLSLVTIGVVKRYEGNLQQTVLAEIERLAWWIGGLGFIGVVLAAPTLQHFLNFQSPVPFILLAISAFLGIPGAFSHAYIQAHQRFGVLSGAGLIGASGKLLASAALVLAGLRTIGAVLGVVLSQLASLAYSIWWARRLGRVMPAFSLARPNLRLVRPELRYAGLVLVTSLAVNTLLSSDIIVMKHYFSPHDAGLYAGIATVGRIIFFLTGPLAGVLIAAVRPGETAHNRALLLRSVGLLGGLGGSALILFMVAPQAVVSVLVGQAYLPVASLLPQLSLAIFALSLANLLVYYHVALRHTSVLSAAVIGLVVTVGLFVVHHATLNAVVESLLAGSLTLIALIFLVTSLESRRVR